MGGGGGAEFGAFQIKVKLHVLYNNVCMHNH